MSTFTDGEYLKTHQYRDAANLNARIQLHQRFSTNPYPWQRWVFDQLDLPSACAVLDVGCGPGDLWLENLERIPGGWSIVLSDLSAGMVLEASRQLTDTGRRFSYRAVDAQALPFPDRSFDVVIANHMLYHVPNRSGCLRELARVLRSGGRLYAATSGRNHLKELRDLVARFCDPTDAVNAPAAFTLKNGSAQLSPYFVHVEVCRQRNGLVVTEAEPLIAYAASMIPHMSQRPRLEALSRAVREQIDARGAIHIQKDSGLFRAVKA